MRVGQGASQRTDQHTPAKPEKGDPLIGQTCKGLALMIMITMITNGQSLEGLPL